MLEKTIDKVFPKAVPKVTIKIAYFKRGVFQSSPKVRKYIGYFC